jgi:hypothetical protein
MRFAKNVRHSTRAVAMTGHVSGDRRLTYDSLQPEQFAMDPRRAPEGSSATSSEAGTHVSRDTREMRRRLFHVQTNRKPRRCQPTTVSGLTMTSAVRRAVQTRDNHTESQRSAVRSRSGRDRCRRCTWGGVRRVRRVR